MIVQRTSSVSMQMLRALYGRPVWIGLVGLTVLYILVWSSSQHKLIYTDEIVFAQDFARIVRGDWADTAIPHPPLYTGLGSISVRLFGEGLPSLRLIGGLSFLAVLWLLPSVCWALSQDMPHARRAGLIAAVIWAVHPLALQGSLLLDIDNTIFPVAMLALLLALGLTDDALPLQRTMGVALAWALMLWTKWLPSTLLLALAIVGVVIVGRKRVFHTLAGLALGSLLFALSFGAFAALTDFPVDRLWITINRTQVAGSGWQRAVSRLVMGGGITAVWIGFPFLLGWLILLVRRARELLHRATVSYSDALLGFTLIGMLAYSAGNELPMGFPRYHYPVFLGMVILVGLFLAGSDTPNMLWRCARSRLAVLLPIGACAAFFALVLPDPLLPQYALTFETNDLSTRLRFGAQLQVTALLIPLSLAIGSSWLLSRQIKPALLSGAIAFSLAGWLVTSAAQTLADYATIYEYGRRGGQETAALVAERTTPHDRLIAPMEILWAARREGDFVVTLMACAECTAERMISRFQHDLPAAFVLTTKEDGRYTHITRDPDFMMLLNRCYASPVAIGTYLAYFRAEPTCR